MSVVVSEMRIYLTPEGVKKYLVDTGCAPDPRTGEVIAGLPDDPELRRLVADYATARNGKVVVDLTDLRLDWPLTREGISQAIAVQAAEEKISREAWSRETWRSDYHRSLQAWTKVVNGERKPSFRSEGAPWECGAPGDWATEDDQVRYQCLRELTQRGREIWHEECVRIATRENAERSAREAFERAERERFEAEKKAWAAQYGSTHLRLALERGYKANRLYAEERAKIDFPDWDPLLVIPDYGERGNPSEVALEVEQQIEARYADLGLEMESVQICWDREALQEVVVATPWLKPSWGLEKRLWGFDLTFACANRIRRLFCPHAYRNY